MTEFWRLVPTERSSGPWNMAVDEALLKLVGDGVSRPTLRFYEWVTPWLSLGSGQLSDEVDRSRAEDYGWHLVRRSSGGAAVLHEGQLGYALVLPTTHRVWQGDLEDSYRRLAEPVRRSLARLGVDAEPATTAQRAERKAVTPPLAERACFAPLGPAELHASGRKIVGNSQIRRRLASAQHGVIQLTGGQSKLSWVLAGATEPDRSEVHQFLEARVGSVADASPCPVTAATIAESMAIAFQEAFEVVLEPGPLTYDELAIADELVITKFGRPEWTFRR